MLPSSEPITRFIFKYPFVSFKIKISKSTSRSDFSLDVEFEAFRWLKKTITAANRCKYERNFSSTYSKEWVELKIELFHNSRGQGLQITKVVDRNIGFILIPAFEDGNCWGYVAEMLEQLSKERTELLRLPSVPKASSDAFDPSKVANAYLVVILK